MPFRRRPAVASAPPSLVSASAVLEVRNRDGQVLAKFEQEQLPVTAVDRRVARTEP
jgi:hypothetical protein